MRIDLHHYFHSGPDDPFDRIVQAIQALKEQHMADFSGLQGDLQQFRTTMADVLADIAMLLDDSSDQTRVEEARGQIQDLTAQLRAAVPDVAPPPEA